MTAQALAITAPRTATAADLIRPFVNARLDRRRDPACPFGGYLPRTAAIDIVHRVHSIDADIRAVTLAGVERCFDGFAEFIPFAAIRRITIRGLDADGETTGTTVYDADGRGGFRVRDAEFDRIAAGQRRFARAGL